MVELSSDKLNELISSIYEAALDPSQWQRFVQQLSQWADGAQIVMHGHDFVANRPLVEVEEGLPPESLEAYRNHFAATNAWVPGITRMQIGKASVPEAALDRSSLLKTEYYNDWLQPMGLGTAAGIVLHRDSSRFLILSSNLRFGDEDRLRQPVLDMLNLLGPHITRAFAITRQLATGEAAGAYWRAAESSAHAVMLLSRRGRVIYANARATSLLGDSTILVQDRSETISFRDPEAQAALEKALGAIASTELVQFKADFVVRGPNLDKLAGSVVPIDWRRPRTGIVLSQWFDEFPVALLYLQATRASADSQFGAQFSLTPAELALVNALARGQSLQDYAEAKRLSVYTVRAQLKAVFAKTNVHRQGELVALFMRNAAGNGL